MAVDSLHRQYLSYASQWMLMRDCYEGPDSIKTRGTLYLPALDAHTSDKQDRYEAYKTRATWYNATGRTIDGLTGAIYQKAPTVEIPARFEEQLKDVTGRGDPFETFAINITRDLMTTGRYGILVDVPELEGPTLPNATPYSFLPYFSGFRAEDVLNWRAQRINGVERLVLLVLREMDDYPDNDDPFVMKVLERIRVCELIDGIYRQAVYVKDDHGKWIVLKLVTPTRRQVPLDFIPFTFMGPNSITAEVKKPPLIDMGHLNLSHYRLDADLKHGLHAVAIPTPWFSGVAKDETGKPIILGANALILGENGRAGMLEFGGQGLGAIRETMKDTERQMAVIGARMLEQEPRAQETLGAVAMRHAGEHANLRTVTQVVEQGLTRSLRIFCWWQGTEPTYDEVETKCELNKEFFATRATPQELQSWIMAYQADTISFETLYFLMTRGEMTRPGVDLEDEKKLIEKKQSDDSARMVESQLLLEGGAGGGTEDEDEEEEDEEEEDENV